MSWRHPYQKPKPKNEREDDPVSGYWYDQEALDEAAGRKRHAILHGSCGTTCDGSVISLNFATYIEDKRRGRC